jgi:hypothetical protein
MRQKGARVMNDRPSYIGRIACWTAILALPALWTAAGRCQASDRGGTGKATPGAAAKQPAEEKPPRKEAAVPLEFLDAVDSRSARQGDIVRLQVMDDTNVEGKLRFRKGAPAQGIIEGVDSPGRFGKRARIRMRLDWVQDINGEHVPLQSYSTGHRYEAGAGGASLGAAIFLGPVGLLGGALVKGGHIVIKKGTRIQARILKPQERPSGSQ